MSAFHHDATTTSKPLQLQIDLVKKSAHVVATADIPEGELLLPPCCPTAKAFPKTTTNARAVPLEVGELRPQPAAHRETYWALPDFRLPQVVKRDAPADAPGATAAAKAADAPGATAAEGAEGSGATAAAKAADAPGDAQDADHPYALEWQGSEAVHFFWGVEALTAEDMARATLAKGQEHWSFNVSLVPREYTAMAKPGRLCACARCRCRACATPELCGVATASSWRSKGTRKQGTRMTRDRRRRHGSQSARSTRRNARGTLSQAAWQRRGRGMARKGMILSTCDPTAAAVEFVARFP